MTNATFIYTSKILERREEKHEYNSHAEDLDAATGHVQHERLHGQRLCWCDSKVQCALFLELVME